MKLLSMAEAMGGASTGEKLCCKGAALSFEPVENGKLYPDASHGGCEDDSVVVDGNDLASEADYSKLMVAVKVLLQGLGEDVNREGLKKTPLRVAKALRDGTRGIRTLG